MAVSSLRDLRRVRFPSSAGIVPLNWLSSSDKVVRFVRLPREDGIEPVNWLSPSNNCVTRPFAFVNTPYHWSSGALLFQFVLLPQFAPLVAS